MTNVGEDYPNCHAKGEPSLLKMYEEMNVGKKIKSYKARVLRHLFSVNLSCILTEKKMLGAVTRSSELDI